MKTPYQLVLIEGLTGAGKSTLAHFVKRQLDFNRIKNNVKEVIDLIKEIREVSK